MDIEPKLDIHTLSPKSKGLLFRLKLFLSNNKMTLQDLIVCKFQFIKTQFNLQQFSSLIKQYDQNLIEGDIDDLFDQLDQSRNEIVFLENIKHSINQLTEEDNPSLVLNRKSRVINNKNEEQEMKAVIQFKDRLLESEDYEEVICLFVTQKDGYLTKTNIGQLCRNFEISEEKSKLIIKFVFGGGNKIGVKDFMSKIGVDSVGRRLKTPISNKRASKKISTEEKSDYIRQNSRIIKPKISEQEENFHNLLEQSINMNLTSSNKSQLIYNIENIPNILKPYFNYGSQLQITFAMFASQYIQQNILFIDEKNPTYSKAKLWIHINQIIPDYNIFQVAKSIMVRDKTRKGLAQMLEPKDIIQGGVGDCYFLSAIAAIVQDYPQLVYRLFILQKNPSHIFGVKLFIDGIWVTIALDGCFPCAHIGYFSGAQPHNKQIWVMLLEKAWAKVFQSYQNIVSGYNQEGLLAISGAPCIQVSTKKKDFQRTVAGQLGQGFIITCATSNDVTQLTDKEQEDLGIFAGHAYTLLKIYQNLPYRNNMITLIKLRNPWGKKSWKKDWSYGSHLWTADLRKRLNYETDPKDGTFFMSLSDFAVYFDHISISKVKLANQNSHVSNKTSKYSFYENTFSVNQKGDYFLTLYQQNPRKYRNNNFVYETSKVWFFLARITKKSSLNQIMELESIACRASKGNCTIQTTLNPGQYVIISKVLWKFHNEHIYTITSYGPSKLSFSKCKVAQPHLISMFIKNRAEQLSNHEQGKLTIYENINVSKRVYMSLEDGIGFLLFNNIDNRMFTSNISFSPCKGITLVSPYQLPLTLMIMPQQLICVGMIIDPQGYSYNIRETYQF